MTEEKEGQNVSKELASAQGVHERLIQRFGAYRTSTWQPTQDNVVILGNQEFEDTWVNLMMVDTNSTEEEKRRLAKDAQGFAHFESQRLFVRSSDRDRMEVEQTLAHEMLHLWFLRSELVEGEIHSYDANETFIDTLALEGLSLYEIPKEERSVGLDGAINVTIPIKAVLDKLGEEGWKAAFEVCQAGDETKIKELTKRAFRFDPPTNRLRKLNDQIPLRYGRRFWDRFKETAVALYSIRTQPGFQFKNPDVNDTLNLVTDWAKVRDQVEREVGN